MRSVRIVRIKFQCFLVLCFFDQISMYFWFFCFFFDQISMFFWFFDQINNFQAPFIHSSNLIFKEQIGVGRRSPPRAGTLPPIAEEDPYSIHHLPLSQQQQHDKKVGGILGRINLDKKEKVLSFFLCSPVASLCC